MHKYLSAIGFSGMKKKDLEILIHDTIEQPDKVTVTRDSEGNSFAEYLQVVSPQVGFAVRGTYNEEDEFEPEYYVPYFRGLVKTTEEMVEIEKHIEKESYAGLCDDPRIGLTLIFSINDTADLLAENKGKLKDVKVKGAYLSALSTNATVLLPIKQENAVHNYINEEKRTKLMEEAAKGDEEAMENLGLQDMNLYSILTKRVQKEDLLTIVSSYFMPYGIESDLYGILGEILDVREVENIITEEHLYIMKVLCNGVTFELCTNKKETQGIPAVGRRIRANIWLLGSLCTDD